MNSPNKKKRSEALFLAQDKVFTYAVTHSGIPFLKALLEPFLGKLEIKDYEAQKTVVPAGSQAHTIVLDAFLQTKEGSVIDVEMQRTNPPGLLKRIRIYMGAIATDLLRKGQEYTSLPDIISIFFCDFDRYGANLPIYTIANKIEELNNADAGDGAKTILVNCRSSLFREDQKEVIDSLFATEPSEISSKPLKDALSLAQQNDKEVLMSMIDVFEEAKAEGRAEGIAEGMALGKAEGKVEGMALGKAEGKAEGMAYVIKAFSQSGMGEDEISQRLRIPEEEVRKMLASA